MESVYFAFNFKPVSYNNGKVGPYHKLLASEFKTKYASKYEGLPFDENIDLQTDLLYLDKTKSKSQMLDIDNISKPIIDSFNGIIYHDDVQVVKRTATHLRAISYDFTEIDVTGLPFEISQIIESVLNGRKSEAVILKVSKINLKDLKGKFL